jgi:hypothetical protein
MAGASCRFLLWSEVHWRSYAAFGAWQETQPINAQPIVIWIVSVKFSCGLVTHPPLPPTSNAWV